MVAFQCWRSSQRCVKLCTMQAHHSTIESEFDTPQAAVAYEAWLHAKVTEALIQAEDPKTARYSSDQVRQRMHALIQGQPVVQTSNA